MRVLARPHVGSKQVLNSVAVPLSYTLSPSVMTSPLRLSRSAAVASSPVEAQLAMSPAAIAVTEGPPSTSLR